MSTATDTIQTPGTPAPAEAPTAALKEQAQTVGQDLLELGRIGKEAAAHELAAVRERGGAAVETAKDQMGAWQEAATRSVQERPLRTLAYAAGAGLVLGFLLRR